MPEMDEIRQRLWNAAVTEDGYGKEAYKAHVVEQYKICLEMADRISQRRATANTFFMTFNIAVVGALAALFKDIPGEVAGAFYLAAMGFCVAWGFLLRSYRTLNSAKFKVIGLLEEKLPSTPFCPTSTVGF